MNPDIVGALSSSSEKQPFAVVKRADGERVYVCDVCGYETRLVILIITSVVTIVGSDINLS